MNDETMRQFPDEDDRRFYEEMLARSDVELLAEMRQLRDSLLADDGQLAHELGLSDEYVEEFSNDIAKLENAMADDRLINESLDEAARAMNAAADRYLAALDPDYPDVLDEPTKKRD